MSTPSARRLAGWVMAFLFVCWAGFQPASAARYYFAMAGDDARNNGRSANSPFKSLTRLNTLIPLLQPGDSVLFRRGDEFKGAIVVTRAGKKEAPLYFGAYGTGAKPVVSGLEQVVNWEKIAANTYEAVCEVCNGRLTNLLINGARQPMGRWPNKTAPNQGYLTMKWASGNNRLVSPAIPDPGKWTGADVVIRTNRWVLERLPVLAQHADTLTIAPTSYDIDREFGFFISNHPLTLDQNGEWYFDKKTNRIRLFTTLNPERLSVEAPVSDHLLIVDHQEFVVVENLVLKGAMASAVRVEHSNFITLRHTEAMLTGSDAVSFEKCRHILFEHNKVRDANSSGLFFAGCRDAVIRYNDVRNVGMFPGMGTGGASYNYSGISIYGASNVLEGNRIDSAGYHGLRFDGDSMMVRNNIISNFCMVKDDGGGIYTWGKGSDSPQARRQIIGNIVYNGIGVAHGTDDTLRVSAEGIYVDDHCNNVAVIGNTTFKCGNVGIFIHNSRSVTIRNNVSFDNGIQLQLLSAGMPQSTIHGCHIEQNTLVARQPHQRVATFITDRYRQDILDMGVIDSNFYCRPANPEMILLANYNSAGEMVNKTFSLGDWKSEMGHDRHSLGAPVRYQYVVQKRFKPLQVIYGFYHQGQDTWYPDCAETSPILRKLKGVNEENGMHKWLIMRMKSAFVKGQNKKYIVQFDTRGGGTGEIIRANFKTRDNQIIASREFRLSADFQTNELLFVPTRLNEPFERVNFEFSNTKVPVWIRNISFREVEAIIPNPDEHILFIVNTTPRSESYPVGKGWKDKHGKPSRKVKQLPPFSSEVFFKE